MTAGAIERLKRHVPWQARVVGKIALSRLPAGYGMWRALSLFRHGAMDRPDYAFSVFSEHHHAAGMSGRAGGFVGMEIGPGDSLFSSLIAHAFGAKATHLVDCGPFANRDLMPYLAMVKFLAARGLPVPNVTRSRSVDEILRTCGSTYHTDGLRSLRAIPDASVDFIWSQAVLEHIRRADFPEFIAEMRRVLKTNGVCSHRIDLKDHLGGSLQNLRFSERIWESRFMSGSGFYTNRLRYHELLEIFGEAGFLAEVTDRQGWNTLPIRRDRLAVPFRRMSDDDLSVSEFGVVLRPLRVA